MTLFRSTSPIKFSFASMMYILVFAPFPINYCIGHPNAVLVCKNLNKILQLPSYSLTFFIVLFAVTKSAYPGIQVACLRLTLLPFSPLFCLPGGQAWRSSSHTSIRFLASLPTLVPTKSAPLTSRFQFQTSHHRPKRKRPLLKSPHP